MAQSAAFKLDLQTLQYGEHRSLLNDDETLCDGALIEVLLACAAQESVVALEALRFGSAPLRPCGRVAMVLADEEAGRYELTSASDGVASARPCFHLSARTQRNDVRLARSASIGPAAATTLDGEEFYRTLARAGVIVAPALRVLRQTQIDEGHASGLLSLSFVAEAGGDGFILHPALAQAALHLAQALAWRKDPNCVCLSRIEAVSVTGVPWTHTARIRSRCTSVHPSVIDVELSDEADDLVARFTAVTFRSQTAHVAEHTAELATEVAAIARETLRLPALEPTQNLVAAGASSLDLARILSALAERWGWSPAIELALQVPTALALAQQYLAEDGSGREFESELDARSTALGPNDDRLSFAEQRLWYLEQFSIGLPAYNEAACWSVEGVLDREALATALQRLVDSHEVLHTVFRVEGSSPRRIVLPRIRVELEAHRVSSDTWAAAEALIGEIRGRRFDLCTGPLLKAAVLELPGKRHLLILVAHHVVLDAWSVSELLLPELSRHYEQAIRREPVQLRPAARGMSQFAARERRCADRGAFDSALEWWREELAGIPTNLELDADYRRPARRTHAGMRVNVDLSPRLCELLRSRAQDMSVTTFVLFFAAYQVLVFRYARERQFLVAVPFSLRPATGAQDQFGCMVNTLPIKVEIDGGVSLRSAIQSAQVRLVAAMARRQVPFDFIVRSMGCERSLSETPLTQIAFSYVEEAAQSLQLSGAIVQPVNFEFCASKFDLMLEMRDRRTTFEVALEFSAELFELERVVGMGDHFRMILEQIARDPDAAVDGDYSAAQASARASLPQLAPWEGIDICWRIAAQLDSGGAATAVIAAGSRVSYVQLAANVAGIEQRLLGAAGRGPRFIGVCTERSIGWVAALLAILRAGSGYVPIDPRVPKSRALELLKRAGARQLLYTRRSCTWAQEFDGDSIELSQIEGAVTSASTAGERHVTSAYAIGTSGSTGTSKLAAVSLCAFSNLLSWYVSYLGVTSDTCFLVMTSIGFDLTQKNVFAALCGGARLVLIEEQIFDPRNVLATIEREQVTVVNCTPTQLYPLLEHCAASDYAALRSLQWVVLGGEAIDGARLFAWMRHPSCHARFVNSYGPTECTDVVAFSEIRADEVALRRPIPIGRAIPNVELAVLDGGLRPVPRGTRGQLFIAGAALGEGYVGDQGGEDSARFRRNAAGVSGYNTGDIVYERSDGELVFVGRMDDEVKVRGHRVSLGDIEAAMRTCPGVTDSAVALHAPDKTGSRLLCGYYVTSMQGTIETSALRRAVTDVLPSYMLPSDFVQLTEIPHTPSGKVDRLALPPPVRPTTRAFEALTKLESALMELWSSVLGRGDLGVDGDFFTSGGHSLLAITLADAIRTRLGYDCHVASIVENPTVRRLAESLAGSERRHGEPAQPKPGA